MSGIRGDWRTFTCFRALMKERFSQEVVRWIFAVALPLLIQEFAPSKHKNVLSAVDTIILDAGAVQSVVFNEIRGNVFPSAVINFCYFHEVKQKFQTEILPGTAQTVKAQLKQTILAGLRFIFMNAESDSEQVTAWQTLGKEISKLPAALQEKVHAFCHDKYSRWRGSIGKVTD